MDINGEKPFLQSTVQRGKLPTKKWREECRMLRKKKRAALVAAIAVVIVAAAAAAVFWFIGRGPDAEKIFSRKYAEYAGGVNANIKVSHLAGVRS